MNARPPLAARATAGGPRPSAPRACACSTQPAAGVSNKLAINLMRTRLRACASLQQSSAPRLCLLCAASPPGPQHTPMIRPLPQPQLLLGATPLHLSLIRTHKRRNQRINPVAHVTIAICPPALLHAIASAPKLQPLMSLRRGLSTCSVRTLVIGEGVCFPPPRASTGTKRESMRGP